MGKTRAKKRVASGTDVFSPNENSLIKDAVSRLAVKVHEYGMTHGKKAVLITGCGLKNGASMVAVDLAAALSRSGYKTLFVDADPRKGSKFDKGLCSYFRGETGIDNIIRPSNLPNLDFAPSGTRIESPALFLSSEKMADFIQMAKDKYDYVIVDSPPVVLYPDASATFPHVDGIVLVCSLDNTTKKQLQSARAVVEPYAEKHYGIVVNSMRLRQYKKHYNLRG